MLGKIAAGKSGITRGLPGLMGRSLLSSGCVQMRISTVLNSLGKSRSDRINFRAMYCQYLHNVLGLRKLEFPKEPTMRDVNLKLVITAVTLAAIDQSGRYPGTATFDIWEKTADASIFTPKQRSSISSIIAELGEFYERP